MAVRFFDHARNRSVRVTIGPWTGSAEWQRVSDTVPVPGWAREGIIQLGLMGATGRMEVDGVKIEPNIR